MASVEEVFNQLVAELDYPMYVVTVADGDSRAGCLVGFTTQASINPPRLLVLLSKENETLQIALRAEVFVVHFLADENRHLAELFGEESGDWTDKFAKCAWHEGPSGVPVLDGVRRWVAGRVLERIDVGDHVAHLLEPIEAGMDGSGSPLTFQQVRDMSPGHPA